MKYNLKDTAGAMADCTKATELNPYFAEAFNNRGFIEIEQQNYQAALADCTKAIDVKPTFGDAYYNRGIVKQKLNDIAGACADWQKSLELGYKPARGMLLQYRK